MSDLAKVNHLSHQNRDDTPKLGDWFWVKDDDDDDKPVLMCVAHLASNHVRFRASGYGDAKVRYRDLLRLTTHEADWKRTLEQRMLDKQAELQGELQRLALTYTAAGMGEDTGEATLLPSTTRCDPVAAKAALVELRDKEMPVMRENVQRIMEQIVNITKDMTRPMKVTFERMGNRMAEVEGRIFALELYAGLAESVKQIADGKPAAKEEPIAVRQMMLFMDEETLFDIECGGMDWRKLDDFDEWLAKPANRDRILPEAKGIVAFRVRRHQKEYPIPDSVGGFMALIHDLEQNLKTYLVMRNGEQLFRLASKVDFAPRLIPLRTEFDKPFARMRYGWREEPDREEIITPEDLEYDEHAAKRKEQVMHYNRVLFLIQGLLDRSPVFSPHPPINMADDAHLERFMRWIRDEEDGLPSANPPKWEAYRDAMNESLVVGSVVWCNHVEIDEDTDRPKKKNRGSDAQSRPTYCAITRISRDRKRVRLSWPWGYRWGYQHKQTYGRGYWGKWGQWPVDRMCHDWVPMDSCFNVAAYTPGEYKAFLCDRYLKGEYLRWAGAMFAAEEWHRAENRPQGGYRDAAMKLAAEHGIVIAEESGSSETRHRYTVTAPAGYVFHKPPFMRGDKPTKRTRLILEVNAGNAVTDMRNWKRILGEIAEAAEQLERGKPTENGEITHCLG